MGPVRRRAVDGASGVCVVVHFPLSLFLACFPALFPLTSRGSAGVGVSVIAWQVFPMS